MPKVKDLKPGMMVKVVKEHITSSGNAILNIYEVFEVKEVREEFFSLTSDKYISIHLVATSGRNILTTEREDSKIFEVVRPNKKYMVFVQGKNTPRYIHHTVEEAKKEAERLSKEILHTDVHVVEIISTVKTTQTINTNWS